MTLSLLSITNKTVEHIDRIDRECDDVVNSLLDLIYPIGSIYMNVNELNPGMFLGGQWEQIKDKFLLSSGDSFVNGTTGGSATKTLDATNIPTHTHSINAAGAHTHTRGTMNITGSVGQGYTSNGTVNGGWHNHNNKGYGTGALYLSGTGNGNSCTWSGYGDAGKITLDASKSWTGATSSDGDHTHTIGNTGSGAAFDVMPPYLVVYIWKRVG